MNETESYICKKILSLILKIPISNLFWKYHPENFDEDSLQPFTLKLISEKLERHIYQSSEDFIKEMRILFKNSSKINKKGSVRGVASNQLSLEFENLVNKYFPVVSKHIIESQKIELLFKELLDSKIDFNDLFQKKDFNEPSSSIFLNNNYYKNKIDELYHLIQLTNSSENILKIAVFIHELQPETIIVGNELSFHFNLMNENTLTKNIYFLK